MYCQPVILSLPPTASHLEQKRTAYIALALNAANKAVPSIPSGLRANTVPPSDTNQTKGRDCGRAALEVGSRAI
jgi:hypothetical protein